MKKIFLVFIIILPFLSYSQESILINGKQVSSKKVGENNKGFTSYLNFLYFFDTLVNSQSKDRNLLVKSISKYCTDEFIASGNFDTFISHIYNNYIDFKNRVVVLKHSFPYRELDDYITAEFTLFEYKWYCSMIIDKDLNSIQETTAIDYKIGYDHNEIYSDFAEFVLEFNNASVSKIESNYDKDLIISNLLLYDSDGLNNIIQMHIKFLTDIDPISGRLNIKNGWLIQNVSVLNKSDYAKQFAQLQKQDVLENLAKKDPSLQGSVIISNIKSKQKEQQFEERILEKISLSEHELFYTISFEFNINTKTFPADFISKAKKGLLSIDLLKINAIAANNIEINNSCEKSIDIDVMENEEKILIMPSIEYKDYKTGIGQSNNFYINIIK